MSVKAAVEVDATERNRRANGIAFGVMVALIVIAPFVAYPFFIMNRSASPSSPAPSTC